MHLIGIDLGGTKTEGIVMTRSGETLARRRVDTPGPGPDNERYDSIIGGIRELVQRLEAECGGAGTVGVCTPGSLSARTGRLKNSNTTCLNGRDIKGDLEAALARPVRIENDANCFALSEAMDGAGAGYRMVFGVIMGTGVGGGIVLDKRLWAGRHHIAGEWGHNVLEPGGPPCYCGKRGCVETFLSGPGLLAGWPDPPSRPATVRALLDRARDGDPSAAALMDAFFERFARALSMVVNILDPDVIVLGGGLSNIDELYEHGAGALAQRVFNDAFAAPLRRNQHGDSSGVRGAAQLWAGDGP